VKLLPAIAIDYIQESMPESSTVNFFALSHYPLLGKSCEFDKQQRCFWHW